MEDGERGSAHLFRTDLQGAVAFDPTWLRLVALPPEAFQHAFGPFHLLDGGSDRILAAGQIGNIAYEKARDLVNIGAYVSGSDPEIDAALAVLPAITAFLQQDQNDFTSFEEMQNLLQGMFVGS